MVKKKIRNYLIKSNLMNSFNQYISCVHCVPGTVLDNGHIAMKRPSLASRSSIMVLNTAQQLSALELYDILPSLTVGSLWSNLKKVGFKGTHQNLKVCVILKASPK